MRFIAVVKIWCGVFPLLMIAGWIIDPVVGPDKAWLRTLLTSLIMVPAMVYGVIPLVRRSEPKPSNRES